MQKYSLFVFFQYVMLILLTYLCVYDEEIQESHSYSSLFGIEHNKYTKFQAFLLTIGNEYMQIYAINAFYRH